MKSFFFTYKSPLSVVLAFILVGGIYFYTRLQTSLFPEITFPKIKIIADNGEQPVNKMMVTVTKPLENAIKQVPDLQIIRSITSRGSCEISAFLNWNSNIDLAKQNIESKISQVRNELPPGVQITTEKMNPSILPVMGYTLESKTKSPIELKQLALYTIKPFLSQIPGTAEVRIIGGKNKEYWLELDFQKMSALSITPDMITSSLNQTNFITTNGYLSDYRRLYLSVTNTAVRNKEELQKLVIFNDGKRVVRLEDIARVNIKEAIEYIKINANGGDGLLIAIIKQPNANLVDVSSLMKAKIELLKPLLPKDVQLKPYYIQADFVTDSIQSVRDSLWIGLALAIIVAILFLRSLRSSLVILITIPITFFATIICLYIFGYTLNIMTLGAIAAAIGLIIDDAIVVVEQIHRTHEEHHGEPDIVLVQKSISYLFPAMLASSLSTIVIFLPFALMGGVAGAYFNVLTNTMIITLICSFFVSWIGLPVIYILLGWTENGRKKKKITDKPLTSQNWVYFFIKRPWISFLIVSGLLVAMIIMGPLLTTGFLPEMDEGSIVLDYSSPPGTSLEETDKMLRQAEKLITKVPEVEAYSRRTGTQMGFFITEPNKGDYLIQLRKKRNRSTEEVIADLRKLISVSQPGLRIEFGQVINDMLGDLTTSVQPIEIKIFGDNQAKLNSLSDSVTSLVSKVKGTADVFDGIVVAGPSIEINPNLQRLAEYKISPAVFQQELQTQLEGSTVGTILEKEQITNIRMIYPGSRNSSLTSLHNQMMFLPDGKMKPISELAKIKIDTGIAELQRENLQSMGVVTARRDRRDIGSVMKDIKSTIQKNIQFPVGYHVEYGGEFADQQKSFSELLTILISASLLVFGVILFISKSFGVAIITLFNAVLGAGGCIIALFITHTALNVGSYTGIIMIVGIIGENAIFTFWQFKTSLEEGLLAGLATNSKSIDLQENGLNPNQKAIKATDSNSHSETEKKSMVKIVEDAVVYSISTRLRPKLMTALGAIVALMPLALGIGVGAQLHQPLAIAVIGGFIVALPLLLLVFPTLLRLIYQNKKSSTEIELTK